MLLTFNYSLHYFLAQKRHCLAGSLAQQIFIRLGAAQYAASRKYRIQTMVNGRVVTSLTTFIIMLAPHFRSFQVMTYLKSNLNSGIGLF